MTRRLVLRFARPFAVAFAVATSVAFCTWPSFRPAAAEPAFRSETARSLVEADPGVAPGRKNSDDAPAYRVRGGQGGGALTSDPPIFGSVGPPETPLALVGLDAGGHNGYGVFLAYVPGRVRHVAALTGGDVAKFSSGAVVVFTKIYDPQSPECCPRTYRATRYTWNGRTLVPGPKRVVPASALGGRSASRETERLHVRPGSPGAAATYAWLGGTWLERCFPDFLNAMGSGDVVGPEPKAGPPIAAGLWSAPFRDGRFPPFLAGDGVSADYTADGTLRSALALAVDPARRTIVFARLGDEESATGYVRDLDGAPAGLATIDATRASDPAAALVVSAEPPRPMLARLASAFGAPTATAKNCSYREVAYRSGGPTPTVIEGVYDASGNPKAFVVQRLTGGE